MKIISAMGLLRDPTDPPPGGPIPLTQQMVVSKVVPFASCTVVEKIACSASNQGLTAGDYVRIIINDAVTPLPPCGNLGRTFGLCTLQDFVQSQAFALAGGNFSACFTTTP